MIKLARASGGGAERSSVLAAKPPRTVVKENKGLIEERKGRDSAPRRGGGLGLGFCGGGWGGGGGGWVWGKE